MQILAQKSLVQPCQTTIVRNLTKFSLRKAKRKSVKAVVSYWKLPTNLNISKSLDLILD